MIKAQLLAELAKRLADVLPPTGMKTAKADLKDNFQGILQAAFAKFDLVNREEFDLQLKLLANARTQIVQLEHKIAALEQSLQNGAKD